MIAGGGGSRVRSVIFLLRRAPGSPRGFSWAQTLVVQGLGCGRQMGLPCRALCSWQPPAGLFVWLSHLCHSESLH